MGRLIGNKENRHNREQAPILHTVQVESIWLQPQEVPPSQITAQTKSSGKLDFGLEFIYSRVQLKRRHREQIAIDHSFVHE